MFLRRLSPWGRMPTAQLGTQRLLQPFARSFAPKPTSTAAATPAGTDGPADSDELLGLDSDDDLENVFLDSKVDDEADADANLNESSDVSDEEAADWDGEGEKDGKVPSQDSFHNIRNKTKSQEGSGMIFEKDGFRYADDDPRKVKFERERQLTAELRTRDVDAKLHLAFQHLPPVPEPVRDILMSQPRVKILESIWDKADLPAGVKKTNLLELNRALRTADYQFFNESFPEEIHETEAFTEQRTNAQRLFEEDRRRAQDDEEKFINSLTDLVLVDIGSHARVTKDGIVNSTSCLLVGGNQRGYGGWGRGKAADFEGAFARAKRNLRKNMVYVPRAENRSLFQSVIGKHNNTHVMLKACHRGMGRTASPLIGHILEAFGIADVSTRVYAAAVLSMTAFCPWRVALRLLVPAASPPPHHSCPVAC
jgi:small subunit ribosomal protein S5